MSTDGDNVIIINAAKVVLTGRKLEKKVYYKHTGYIGGIKERTAKSILDGRFPERIVEKADRAHAAARSARPRAARQSAGLSGRRASARGAAAGKARYRRDEPQEHEDRVTWPRPSRSLEDLSTLKPAAAPEAPKYVQKLDKQGRAYATGKRKDAVARVWIKPGAGKIMINDRTVETYFARPVLRMLIQQPLVAANRQRPVRRDLHRLRRRTFGPGRRRASRPFQGADALRAGPARRAQARRLPHPRLRAWSSARSTARPRRAAASSSPSADGQRRPSLDPPGNVLPGCRDLCGGGSARRRLRARVAAAPRT